MTVSKRSARRRGIDAAALRAEMGTVERFLEQDVVPSLQPISRVEAKAAFDAVGDLLSPILYAQTRGVKRRAV
jgi:hypothetical protein